MQILKNLKSKFLSNFFKKMEEIFKQNDTFDSYEQFSTLFFKWCEDNFHPVHIEKSHKIKEEHLVDVSRMKSIKYKDINITCIHYGEHNNTKTQGLRQRVSCRIDCKFEIRLNFGKSLQKFIITYCNLQHNHSVRNENYQRYPKTGNQPKMRLRLFWS